jgi:hypothetical protein
VNDELENTVCGRKRSWPNLRYYLGICLERLRKTTKNLSQDSLSPGRGLNPRLSEYEVGDTPVKHADGQKRPNCSSILCTLYKSFVLHCTSSAIYKTHGSWPIIPPQVIILPHSAIDTGLHFPSLTQRVTVRNLARSQTKQLNNFPQMFFSEYP